MSLSTSSKTGSETSSKTGSKTSPKTSPKTYGFGVDPAQKLNHFLVLMPEPELKTSSPPQVRVFERFSWTLECEQKPGPKDIIKLNIFQHKWNEVSDALAAEFNFRLKKDGLKPGKFFKSGAIPVERLFGKEMMVLLWAIEACESSVISTAIRNWKGLLPEERWWLYTMTNAATGGLKDLKGWRIALRYALCENPVIETKQRSLFDGLTVK
jgi:hypothetical protein